MYQFVHLTYSNVCSSTILYLGDTWNLDVYASSQASAKVGRTGEDVAKVLVPHEFIAILFDEILHL